jgi:glycosyltransferase involved in cell wall biosynthesis
VLDIVHYIFPEEIARLQLQAWKALFPPSLRRATEIITISRNVSKELIQLFPYIEAKVNVVYLGVDQRTLFPRCKEAAPPDIAGGLGGYILSVCSASKRKNLTVLLKAFKQLRCQHLGLRLVLARNTMKHTQSLRSQLADLGLNGVVEFTGRVGEAQLVGLYQKATAFVFASLYEGFGLPSLEAMACGCPIVASNASAIPEVVGDGAILFDPQDPDDLARSLLEVLGSGSLRSALSVRGFANFEGFSWRETAHKTAAIYSRCCGHLNSRCSA